MRLLYVVLGAILGWILLGVATGFSLALVVVYGGADPNLERYGGALGALVGIVVGGFAGNSWYWSRREKLTPTGTRPLGTSQHPGSQVAALGPQPSGSVLPKLEELDALHRSGRISTDEWKDLRARLLGAHFGEQPHPDDPEPIRAPGWYRHSNGYSEIFWDGKAWTDRRG